MLSCGSQGPGSKDLYSDMACFPIPHSHLGVTAKQSDSCQEITRYQVSQDPLRDPQVSVLESIPVSFKEVHPCPQSSSGLIFYESWGLHGVATVLGIRSFFGLGWSLSPKPF